MSDSPKKMDTPEKIIANNNIFNQRRTLKKSSSVKVDGKKKPVYIFIDKKISNGYTDEFKQILKRVGPLLSESRLNVFQAYEDRGSPSVSEIKAMIQSAEEAGVIVDDPAAGEVSVPSSPSAQKISNIQSRTLDERDVTVVDVLTGEKFKVRDLEREEENIRKQISFIQEQVEQTTEEQDPVTGTRVIDLQTIERELEHSVDQLQDILPGQQEEIKEQDATTHVNAELIETEQDTEIIDLNADINVAEQTSEARSGSEIRSSEAQVPAGQATTAEAEAEPELTQTEVEVPKGFEALVKSSGGVGFTYEPLYMDSIGIFFKSSTKPEFNDEIMKDRFARLKDVPLESLREPYLMQNRMLFEKYSARMLIPEILIDESSPIEMIIKSNFELIQLWNVIEKVRSKFDTAQVKLSDLMALGQAIPQGSSIPESNPAVIDPPEGFSPDDVQSSPSVAPMSGDVGRLGPVSDLELAVKIEKPKLTLAERVVLGSTPKKLEDPTEDMKYKVTNRQYFNPLERTSKSSFQRKFSRFETRKMDLSKIKW